MYSELTVPIQFKINIVFVLSFVFFVVCFVGVVCSFFFCFFFFFFFFWGGGGGGGGYVV